MDRIRQINPQFCYVETIILANGIVIIFNIMEISNIYD